jgi:hypothetical protein
MPDPITSDPMIYEINSGNNVITFHEPISNDANFSILKYKPFIDPIAIGTTNCISFSLNVECRKIRF